MVLLGAVSLWSVAGFVILNHAIDLNGTPGRLPTESFLRSGTGHVLDIGAGTGRSSIMVLEARPHATLVASDLFGESFDNHFGNGDSPQARLLANLKGAGVEQRASIETADMRDLPFESASFDAVVSAYAMDHLGREGSTRALKEAARVVKPGGDFLLMLVANDKWVKFAFGPLAAHGGVRSPEWWSEGLKGADFQIVEEGTIPATRYFLARRR
jgi:SAM-dependent methyltransferase